MWFFKLYRNLAHTATLKAISPAPCDRNEGSSGSSRPSISPSKHLVGSNPSGSYLGSGNPYPGLSIDSPPLLASGMDLSTPRPSGISPLLALPLSHPWQKTRLRLEVTGVLPQTLQHALPTHSLLHLSISLNMHPLHPVILKKPILVSPLICGISIWLVMLLGNSLALYLCRISSAKTRNIKVILQCMILVG